MIERSLTGVRDDKGKKCTVLSADCLLPTADLRVKS